MCNFNSCYLWIITHDSYSPLISLVILCLTLVSHISALILSCWLFTTLGPTQSLPSCKSQWIFYQTKKKQSVRRANWEGLSKPDRSFSQFLRSFNSEPVTISGSEDESRALWHTPAITLHARYFNGPAVTLAVRFVWPFPRDRPMLVSVAVQRFPENAASGPHVTWMTEKSRRPITLNDSLSCSQIF